jgi:hypothetical protein
MRIAFCLRRHHRAAAAGILLLLTAMVIGVAACDGDGGDTYQLAISSATGGAVIAPGAGTFAYDAGMVVQLVATPDEGYEFRSWTGDTEGIADPNAASTTITMNGNYAIVANFQTEGGEVPDGGGSNGGGPDEGGPYS